MIALAPWQALLDALGWVVAKIYEYVPDYGITIILLTVLIRTVLLPLGIKQIRSMHTTQLIQPEMKKLQAKYKNDRAKQQEEIMKLYQRYGVSPLSGCWPVLLQFPILIAMYSVLRHPQSPNHIPADSALNQVMQAQIPDAGPSGSSVAPPATGTTFLGMNLVCSALQSGSNPAEIPSLKKDENGDVLPYKIDCGEGLPDRIPYFAFAALMFVTTWYQQRQMQKSTPPNAASQQQQALLKVMPLMFGVFGFTFPSGLVLYWTVSNAWQIGQQYFMLKSRPTAEALTAKAEAARKDGTAKKGLMAKLSEQAEQQRRLRGGDGKGGGQDGGRGPRR